MRRASVSACPFSSNAITTTAAPYLRTRFAWRRNGSSPSLRLIELTMPLPCRHLRPASITLHFDVDHLRAVFHLLAGDRERFGVVAGEDQARERLRAGDVGALADIDEKG